MLSYDVTLTATRRPDLLRRTLESFDVNLFREVPPARLLLNIDPLWGNDAVDRELENIGRDYFRDVVVRRPSTPSFGGAVRWLWSQVETPWFLHLEDDWLLLRPVRQRMLKDMAREDLGQLRFPLSSPFGKRRRRKQGFGTSPCFMRRTLGHAAAEILNPDLDPEKQFFARPEGLALMQLYAYKYLGSMFTPCMVRDIGRDWRQERGIEKQMVNGESVWSAAGEQI